MNKQEKTWPERKRRHLTSHFPAMYLEIEGAGHGVLPRERFGQTGQLIGLGASKQGLQAGFLEGQMPHGLEKVQQDKERHGQQHELLQRFNHTDRLGWSVKCEENKVAHRVLQARSAMVIGRERSRGREDTLGGTPHGYTWIHPSQRAWREQGIGPEEKINMADSHGASHSHLDSTA